MPLNTVKHGVRWAQNYYNPVYTKTRHWKLLPKKALWKKGFFCVCQNGKKRSALNLRQRFYRADPSTSTPDKTKFSYADRKVHI